jgi:ribosomal protein L13E
MIEPGSEPAVVAGGDEFLPVYRQQVASTLRASLVQGRLTEDEFDERMGQAAASRSRAELAALIADLPVGRMDAPARPPTSKDVRVGVGVTIAAVGVIAAILLTSPDNALAFLAFILAAVTLLVAPIVTLGVMVDVRRQKRHGGQVPSWPVPGPGGTPSQRPASAPAEPLPPIDRGQQHTAEAARSDLARRQSPDRRSAHQWRPRRPRYTVDYAGH